MKTFLFNPFKRYSEQQLLLFGGVTAIFGVVFASLTNTHFDGVLDTHFGHTVTFKTAAFQSIINIVSIVLVFYPAGKWINSKTRLIDIFNLSLIIKIPAYFMMPLNINNWAYLKTEPLLEAVSNPFNLQFTPEMILFLALSSILAIGVFVWLIILLYNGFKVATNLKETKHIILFILAIIVAEIVSKVLLMIL
ncbi:MAG: hypothetical protein NXH73_09115 [Flavobacteriaceae bacterium]|nr:hypothetical protein [Flavobacteriaceae bacterium]